jgi:hypothetical protein
VCGYNVCSSDCSHQKQRGELVHKTWFERGVYELCHIELKDIEIALNEGMELLIEWWVEHIKLAVLVVSGDFWLNAFKMTAIRSCEIVLRVYSLDFGALLKMEGCVVVRRNHRLR